MMGERHRKGSVTSAASTCGMSAMSCVSAVDVRTRREREARVLSRTSTKWSKLCCRQSWSSSLHTADTARAGGVRGQGARGGGEREREGRAAPSEAQRQLQRQRRPQRMMGMSTR
jgi:hypothetical protein